MEKEGDGQQNRHGHYGGKTGERSHDHSRHEAETDHAKRIPTQAEANALEETFEHGFRFSSRRLMVKTAGRVRNFSVDMLKNVSQVTRLFRVESLHNLA